ncbi:MULTISPECIES: MbcA/ParS/Xre antitoxin family protein [Acinetobacter]|uniref:XRE family transcriptional regulator n=1 Tax=Acinetobacter indicus TaxID=756892 RepID=A0A6C0Y639_9GAMM|nr:MULTISPECIES: XRE family transcriptional regulator [Acinetobacter]QIC71727.1 XRE family transcriptional regulator [Acinetobacter indicus]QKQ71635.1 XRE family transcriptional regulator [Acinetobacter sp. 10FS3-1]
MSDVVERPKVDRKAVLSKALLNAADQLKINQADLAEVIGVHRTAISKLKKKPDLDPDSKAGELAVLFIRLYRGVYALNGGNQDWMLRFLNSPNKATGGVPAQQIKTVQGLVHVVQYLDAMPG